MEYAENGIFGAVRNRTISPGSEQCRQSQIFLTYWFETVAGNGSGGDENATRRSHSECSCRGIV